MIDNHTQRLSQIVANLQGMRWWRTDDDSDPDTNTDQNSTTDSDSNADSDSDADAGASADASEDSTQDDSETQMRLDDTDYPQELLTDEAKGEGAREEWEARREGVIGLIEKTAEGDQLFTLAAEGPAGQHAWIQSDGLVRGGDFP